MRNISIDGTDSYGLYGGSETQGPWAVHDDDKQDWLITGLRWRWTAALIAAIARRTNWRAGIDR